MGGDLGLGHPSQVGELQRDPLARRQIRQSLLERLKLEAAPGALLGVVLAGRRLNLAVQRVALLHSSAAELIDSAVVRDAQQPRQQFAAPRLVQVRLSPEL